MRFADHTTWARARHGFRSQAAKLMASALLPSTFAAAQAAQRPVPVAGPTLPTVTQILWRDGVKDAYPRWSNDGKRILFQSNRTGKWQLFVMDANGSHQTHLPQPNANNDLPDWSPDNERIAFVSDRDGNEEV